MGGGAIELWDPYGFNVLIIAAFSLVILLGLFLAIRRRGNT